MLSELHCATAYKSRDRPSTYCWLEGNEGMRYAISPDIPFKGLYGVPHSLCASQQ